MLTCRDGYVALSMPSPEMWERLCLMIERPDLSADPRFATALDRRRHADELDAILSTRCGGSGWSVRWRAWSIRGCR
jgi:itaconate CoA-transferase